MMNNLFSMFDPSSSYISMSWLVLAMAIVLVMEANVSKMKSKSKVINKIMLNKVDKEMSELSEMKNKMSTKMLMKIFMMIVVLNILALFPFNFTTTAHLSISFTMSMTLWASVVAVGLINIPKKVLTHLTPMGCPNALMNFMVIIETVSLMIRPITLSVRMSANMVAGHLLLSLLSNFSMNSSKNSVLSAGAMMILIFLEMAVAFIQAYVFITLTMLYQNEMK